MWKLSLPSSRCWGDYSELFSFLSVLHSQALLSALRGPVTMGTYACFLALSNTGFHFLCTWQSQRALKYAVLLLADWCYKVLHCTVNSLCQSSLPRAPRLLVGYCQWGYKTLHFSVISFSCWGSCVHLAGCSTTVAPAGHWTVNPCLCMYSGFLLVLSPHK